MPGTVEVSAVWPREGRAAMVLLRQLLGDVLRRLRLRQGRTLREVSASARVSLGYLSEVERGQKEASSELLAAICGALNTPLSQVFREVSDNFALAELQSEPVLADPQGARPAGARGRQGRPDLRSAASLPSAPSSRTRNPRWSSRKPSSTGPPATCTGSPTWCRSEQRDLGAQIPSTQTQAPSTQTQALGFSVRLRTMSGRLPDTMSASETCSRTARSLARSAIHTCCRGSATPG